MYSASLMARDEYCEASGREIRIKLRCPEQDDKYLVVQTHPCPSKEGISERVIYSPPWRGRLSLIHYQCATCITTNKTAEGSKIADKSEAA